MASKVSTAKGDVSMDLLLSSLDDQKNIGAVKKKLTDLDKDHAAPKYVSKVVADRAGREVTYNATSGEVSKWQNFVVTNRNASMLDIANDKRELPTARGLVKKFEPRTDMENEIQMILVKSNSQSDDAIQKAEVDELQQRNIPIEEIKARQAELAKVKSLLFYQQLKQHRVNKIKSKAYHRIKKRQRQRAAEAEKELALQSEDAAAVAEIEEEEATRRMKERMNLKHKNTGKWAKMALQHGKHDKNLRAAYHESVQYGNELSSKMNSMPHSRNKNGDEFGSDDSGSDDEDDGSDDDDGEDNGDAFDEKHGKEKKKSVSSSAARKITDLFSSNGEGEDEAEAAAATGKYRKIFEMDFMKKAAETQREKARLEAGNILKELQAMEEEEEDEEERDADQGEGEGFGGDEGESGEEGGRGDRRQQVDAAKKEAEERLRAEAKKQIDALFTAGAGGGAGGMSMAKRKAGGVSSSSMASTGVVSSAVVTTPSTSAAPSVKGETARKPTSSSSTAILSTAQQQPAAKIPTGGSRILPATTMGKTSKERQHAAVAPAAEAPAAAPAALEAAEPAKKAGPKEKKPLLLSQRTQEDLVEMAFAGPDLESEFATMKRDTIDAELGIDEKKKAIENQVKAGWGDWAGPGNTGISQKTLSKRDRLMKIQEIEADKKRSERTDVMNKSMMNVVLSDRRVKTASKYKIDEIPHPFTTREEYERSLQMPIGEEWNATNVVRNNTKPEVLLRAGRIIEPAKLPAEDRKRHAAKMEQEASGEAPGNRTFKRSHANKKHKK